MIDFFVVLAGHLLVLDGFDQLLSLALPTLSEQCSCRYISATSN